jgi:hypothetical protein
MVDRFVGITAKIERAEEHINNFGTEWIAFGRRAYEIVPDQDLDEAGRRVFRISVNQEIPPRLSTIIGDAVQSMRSALDHLIFQLLAAKGVPAGRHHYFPIAESADKFEASYQGKVQGVGDEAERLISALKPYKGGTDGYWTLDELSKTDKHRLLLTTVIRPEGLALNLADAFAGMPLLSGAERDQFLAGLRNQFILIRASGKPCPVLKDGDEIYSEPGDKDPDQYTQFGFAIAFGDGEILECEPVTPSLRQLLGLVKGAVEPFRPLLP